MENLHSSVYDFQVKLISFFRQKAWFLDPVYENFSKNIWIWDPVYERTVEKTIPWRAAHPWIAYVWEYHPPPAQNDHKITISNNNWNI